jgi:hypothetical protein
MLMSADIIEKYFDVNPPAREEIGDLPKILKGEIKRLVALLQQFRSFRMPSDAHLQSTSVAWEVREIVSLQSVYYAAPNPNSAGNHIRSASHSGRSRQAQAGGS